MAAGAKIIDLRNLLAERFPHPSCTTARRLITGLRFLEESIGGGLPRGAITEMIRPGTSAGSASLIHALVHCAYRDNYFLALIDGRDCLTPAGWIMRGCNTCFGSGAAKHLKPSKRLICFCATVIFRW